MALEGYLRAAPKAELHVHLEGSTQPATLFDLAQRNGVALPVRDEAELREWFAFRDFHHFIEVYVAITRCLRTVEDYEQIVVDFGREMARQRIRYAEVTFSPSTHQALGIPHEVWFTGLAQGRRRIRQELGVEVNWVFDLVRNPVLTGDVHARADYTTAVAIEGQAEGVVALGLGGLEACSPPEPFAPYFARALAAGLHSDPHAGELAGPESVWGALRALQAERLGHGVRAGEDPALVAYLAEHAIPIEVNPTSNLRLGVYPSYAEHPLPRLLAAGVPLTVNSDDPPLFNTTLTDELLLLPKVFGLDLATIDALLLNGVRQSFLPEERKARLLAEFEAELERLKAEHLGPASADETRSGHA